MVKTGFALATKKSDLYKRFETPHPNKKARTIMTDGDYAATEFDASDVALTAGALFMDPSQEYDDYPKDSTGPPHDMTGREASGSANPAMDAAKWIETVAKIQQEPDSVFNQELQVFLENLRAREESKARLMQVFDENLNNMAEKIAYMTGKLVNDFYDSHREHLANMEADIIKTLKENHLHRQYIVKTLEAAKSAMEWKCESLMASISNNPFMTKMEGEDVSLNGGAYKETGMMKGGFGVEAADNKTLVSVAEGTLEGDDALEVDGGMMIQDPDWNEMGELYEPVISDIQVFFDGRAKLQEADEKFTNAIEELGLKFDDLLNKFTQIAYNAYDAIDQPLGDMQFDIQALLMDNLERRERYQEFIQQRADAAKNLFTRLMSRTLGGVRRGFMEGFGFQKQENQKKRK